VVTRERALLAALSIVSLATAPAAARANGRLPEAGQIAFDPSDSATIVVRTTFGLLVTHDNGTSWRWVCESALRVGFEDPSVFVTGDGTIVLTTANGVERSTDGGCSWEYPDPALQRYAIDGVVDPSDPSRAYVVLAGGDPTKAVYVTDDNGASWAQRGDRYPIDVFFETIEIARADPLRLYLTGSIPPLAGEPRHVFLFQSNDGGGTWKTASLQLAEPEANVFLSAVDPDDPDRVYARARTDTGDHLIISEDGGASWRDTFMLSHRMPGFALSPDGAEVWVGGVEDGLWHSSDRGETFSEVSYPAMTCLAAREGELWICEREGRDGYAIGRSTDGGATIEMMLRFANIQGPVECPSGTPTGDMCPLEWPLLQTLLTPRSLFDAGAEDEDAGREPEPPAPPAASGCGCRAAGSTTPASRAALVAIAAALGIVAPRTARRHVRRSRRL